MKNILIVDDVEVIRTAIKNTIAQLTADCTYFEASNGVDALHHLSNKKIDLILLDWKMPELSGIEFLKKVRSLKFNMPVIMITGESDIENVKEALQSGATAYIKKPVTKEILKEKLTKLNFFKEKE